MLNEDQASCEKLFVRKPSGKHRNSTVLEDNGVSEGKTECLIHVSDKDSAHTVMISYHKLRNVGTVI